MHAMLAQNKMFQEIRFIREVESWSADRLPQKLQVHRSPPLLPFIQAPKWEPVLPGATTTGRRGIITKKTPLPIPLQATPQGTPVSFGMKLQKNGS